MPAMSKAQQMLASLSGNIESAYIIVYDFRGVKNTTKMVDEQKIINNVATNVKVEKVVNVALGNFTRNTQGDKSLLGSLDSLKSMSADGGVSKIFRMQFNPTQFQVYATSYPPPELDVQGCAPALSQQTPVLPTFTTSFWFDQSTAWECFPGDKFDGGLAPTNIAKNAMTAVKKKRSSEPNVQQKAEAFLAALRDPHTRMISFRWADFVFTGELLSVGVTYTMFATDGTPVRAQVDMRMQQKDIAALFKPWTNAYDTLRNASF